MYLQCSSSGHQVLPPVVPVMDIAIVPLFKSLNSVSPEGIVVMEVIKGFVLPGIYVEEPLAWTTVEGMSENLWGRH